MKPSRLSEYLNDFGSVDCVSKNINGEIMRRAFFPRTQNLVSKHCPHCSNQKLNTATHSPPSQISIDVINGLFSKSSPIFPHLDFPPPKTPVPKLVPIVQPRSSIMPPTLHLHNLHDVIYRIFQTSLESRDSIVPILLLDSYGSTVQVTSAGGP